MKSESQTYPGLLGGPNHSYWICYS